MVWDRGLETLVVPTRWDLLGVALGGAPVWPSSGGVGFTEKSVVRRPPCYLPLGQLTHGQNNTCKCDTEGSVPVSSLCGVVGLPSFFIRYLIGRTGNI